MNDKISRLPHIMSGFQLLLAAFWRALHGLSLYEMMLVMSLIISPLAFVFSIWFQWRQTRAIEKAAAAGKTLVKQRGFFK